MKPEFELDNQPEVEVEPETVEMDQAGKKECIGEESEDEDCVDE